MEKSRLIASIRESRARWEALLAEVPRQRMEEPGAAGHWSVKDVVAHLAWHELEMIGMLRARALVGSPLWNLPTDERNAAIYEQNRHRPLKDVLAEAGQAYPQLLAELEKIASEDLNDPDRFAGMPPDWVPAEIIAQNTFEHYDDHIPWMKDWLEREDERA